MINVNEWQYKNDGKKVDAHVYSTVLCNVVTKMVLDYELIKDTLHTISLQKEKNNCIKNSFILSQG